MSFGIPKLPFQDLADQRSGHSASVCPKASAIATSLLLTALPSSKPLPRGPISGITLSLRFLGDPTPVEHWLAAYSGLMDPSAGESLQGFPVPCIDGSVRVGPCYTPAPQRVETENRIVFSAVSKIGFAPCSGSVPFWACLSASFGRIGLTMPRTHVCFRCPY